MPNMMSRHEPAGKMYLRLQIYAVVLGIYCYLLAGVYTLDTYLDLPVVCKICAFFHPQKPTNLGRNFTYLEDPGMIYLMYITTAHDYSYLVNISRHPRRFLESAQPYTAQ